MADNGPGIPDEEKPKVPTRFYRGDASRGTPGVGLGLTLVASVAKVHGGALELSDNHPGLRAQMVFAAGPAGIELTLDPHDRADAGKRHEHGAEEVRGRSADGKQSAPLLQ